MKSFRIPFLTTGAAAALAAFALTPLRAQDAGLSLAPATTPAAEPEVTLIPEIPPEKKPEPTPKPEKQEKSKTEQSTEALLTRIHYRQAYTKARREPKITAEWDRAERAKTDYERREALKAYYKLLHDRILKIDPTVKTESDLRRATSLRRLEQTRIDPTQPYDFQDPE